MLNLVQPLRLNFLYAPRYPTPFDQIEYNHAAYEDSQQNFSHVTEVSDQTHHGAAEKISDAAENKHPKKTAGQRKRHKPGVGHPGDAIKSTRSPAQSVNVLRNKNRKRAEAIRHPLDAGTG